MLRLNEGNVLLNRSHRKQLLTCLKRIQRLGQRLGDFLLTISLRRSGKAYEVKASVHDRAGDFDLRSRKGDWQSAVRELIWMLSARLHQQYLQRQTVRA